MNNFIEENKTRFLEELTELLSIPSVSTDSQYKNDVLRAAQFIEEKLKTAGVDFVEIHPTKGHPIVYAEKIIDKDLPTVLVYGHYDVQPADPLELWDSPPFEPVIRDNKIYARGASDDKGQMYIHIKAFETMMAEDILACNIKFMIEGEEEVGSDNLEPFLEKHKEKLKADVVLISDTSIFSEEQPSITAGLRGLSYVEVEVTGPNRDLHSGVYGGAVANPINVLCEMIASLKDENNHITIPNFYDDVEVLSPEERKVINTVPFSEKDYKAHLDVDDLSGEKGFTPLEHVSIRPTLDVNGIWGGYTAEGAKTVLPSKAYAKISMRLVPKQSSEKITALFQKHFESIAPKSVKVNVTPHHGGEPAVTPVDSPAYKAAEQAFEKVWGVKPLPKREGGSIPVVAAFESILGLKAVMLGFGYDSDAIHSPNEHFSINSFYKGIEITVLFHQFFAEMMLQEA